MADIKISQLGEALAVTDNDILPMTASGVTSKVKASTMKSYMVDDLDVSDLHDTTITTPTDDDGLVYDATAQKWENVPIMTKEQWKKNGAYNLANCVADTEAKSGFILTKVVDSNTGGVTYTISGTDSGSTGTQYIVANDAELLATMKHYAGTKVKLVGCPTGGDTTNGYFVAIYFNYGAGDVPVTYNDIGDGIEVSVPATVNTARLAITLRHNANPSGKTFKPMITTDLNATYDDYVPHAMTNRQLTEVKTITGVSVTSTAYSLEYASVKRVGNIVQVSFSVKITSNLSAGGNADGTLTGLPLPLADCQGDTYTGTKTVGWLLQSNGLLRIRAIDALSANEYVAFGATYICK